MQDEDVPLLEMDVPQDRLPGFFPLLGGGFEIHTEVGLTLSEWFARQPGLDARYLKERVQTIFLDGRAVDDADRAVLHDGATLALSAAMPGLVGATFRKGGRYAALRDVISYGGRDDMPSIAGDGTLRLKLFNMVAAEIGPLFLSRGIRVAGADLADFLETLPETFRRDCGATRLGGRPIVFTDLVSVLADAPRVCLRVMCPDENPG